jgi:tetratricopeptide (TPR) repeat protein
MVAASAAHGADEKCEIMRYAELPATMSSGRPIVPGAINGVEGNFFIDSGSFFSFISNEFANQLQLRLRDDPSNAENKTNGRSLNAKLTTVKEFSLVGFGSKPVNNVDFLVVNAQYGRGVMGGLGQNVVGAADSEYDLAKGFIRLFRTKNCGGRPLSYWNPNAASIALATTEAREQFVGTVLVNGHKIRAFFDSNNGFSVITLKAAKAAGFDPKAVGVTQAEMWTVNGRQIPSWIARFDSIAFGTEEIKNTRIRVVDVSYGDLGDMLLGLDFFLSHRIYFAKDQRIAYLTHNGGPVFALSLDSANRPATAASGGSSDAPKSAAGFRLRGAGSFARKEFDAAIADFDQAVKLDPNDFENFRQRALAHGRMQNYELAIADMTRALALQPQSVDMFIERGSLRFYNKDSEGGMQDYQAALNLKPNDSLLELRIARVHEAAGRVDEAVRGYDNWAAKYPKDAELPTVLNDNCWLRVTKSTQFDAAIPICNASVKAKRTGQTLDTRGMAWLRVGNNDKAIEDYKAALKIRPNNAWSLYGLSIAEARKGNLADAAKHRDAALGLQASIVEEFKKIGVEN